MKRLRALVAPLAAALCACSAPKAPDAAPGTSLIENFSMAGVNATPSRWRLKALTARMEEKRGLMFFTAPDVKFYDGNALSSEITSLNGKLLMREKDAELTGSVHVDSRKDGMTMDTTVLYFSTARNKIWTKEPVLIHRGRTIITGRDFTANPDLSEIEIRHQETHINK